MSSLFKTAHIKKATRHLLLCCEKEKSKCCSPEISQNSWDFLKSRLRELKLVGSGLKIERPDDGSSSPPEVIKVIRSKVGCLQVCSKGPIAVVYPEGAWYHSCTPEVLEKIIQTHILGGKIYKPNLITINNLNSGMSLPMSDGVEDAAETAVGLRASRRSAKTAEHAINEADIFKSMS